LQVLAVIQFRNCYCFVLTFKNVKYSGIKKNCQKALKMFIPKTFQVSEEFRIVHNNKFHG